MLMKNKYSLSKKEGEFLLKKNIVELVYNTGKFEGLNTTLLQTEEIIKHKRANNVNVDDVVTILNLKKGFEEIINSKETNYFEFSKKINGIVAREDALIPGEIRTGSVTVSTAEKTYIPGIPNISEVQIYFKKSLDNPDMSQTERAIRLFLYMTKNQLFWDGNKRTATVTVNKYMFDNGLGLFTIPSNKFIEFNQLLGNYYNNEETQIDIMTFIYEECLFGIEYQ